MKMETLIALDWAIRCFGSDHVFDRSVRALRLAEEAVELTQALHVSRDMMHKLIDTVYDRPVAKDFHQEIGGVALTLQVLCGALGQDPETFFTAELRRVLAKTPEHFAKRNEEKLQLGLTGAS